MTPPVLIYLAMGLIVARIMLDRIQPRGFTWLNWLQFLVNAARITLLWPLVLFLEKIGAWLKAEPDEQPPTSILLERKIPAEEVDDAKI